MDLRGPDIEARGAVPDAVRGAVDCIDDRRQARRLGPVEDTLSRRVVPVQVDLAEDGLVFGFELANLLNRQVGIVGVLPCHVVLANEELMIWSLCTPESWPSTRCKGRSHHVQNALRRGTLNKALLLVGRVAQGSARARRDEEWRGDLVA